MIELSAQQQLALLFPKSNRALIETLEKASPEQLQKLSEAKDLKSLITGLMNDSLDVSKSNKIILDILKNSAFFKELGNFSKDVKTLIELLSAQSNSPYGKTAKSLQALLMDFSDNDSSRLKDFVKNSGIFLESKLSQGLDPKQELKTALQALQTKLRSSEMPQIKSLMKDIETLINKAGLFEKSTDMASLNSIKDEVGKILSGLKDILKLADPIYTKNVQRLVNALDQATEQKALKTDGFSLGRLGRHINELASELRTSTQDVTKNLLSELESIGSKVKTIQKTDQTQALIKSLLKELESVQTKALSSAELKNLNSTIEKVRVMSTMRLDEIEALDQNQLKTFFTALPDDAMSTKSKSIFDIIEKILSSLKQPLASFEEQKLPQDIKTWLNHFNKELGKGDILYSKSMQNALEKIELFAKPAHLLNNNLLQESLQKDMKALLLGLEKDLAGTAANTEMIKTVDKLLVQIDYFQLLSNLSNSSYLYVPYAWDQLENGNLAFKKSQDGSSYCEIDLELSEYGKLNMMLQLFEDNQLNIMIYTQKKELKELFKANMKALRSALVGVNIMPRNIHLHDLNETNKTNNPYQDNTKLNELGFEAKG